MFIIPIQTHTGSDAQQQLPADTSSYRPSNSLHPPVLSSFERNIALRVWPPRLAAAWWRLQLPRLNPCTGNPIIPRPGSNYLHVGIILIKICTLSPPIKFRSFDPWLASVPLTKRFKQFALHFFFYSALSVRTRANSTSNATFLA